MVVKKRKKRRAPAVIAVVIIIALVAGVGIYLGYGQFVRDSHPIKYESYVEKYSAQNGIDKYLVYAFIKTESGFDPGAHSNVGARGLMQIMEDTFEWIKYKKDDDEAVYYDMYTAKKNIEYGCWLLGYLYKEFGNTECVAAAYHAGISRVNEWLADKKYSDDGIHLKVIPVPDTAHYVEKIKNAVETYKRLYQNK